MQIQPITELDHNSAIFTLTAERQELLYYRAKVQELEKVIAEQVKTISGLEESERVKMEYIDRLQSQVADKGI